MRARCSLIAGLVLVLGVLAGDASAAQMRGAVINDVFNPQKVGTAALTASTVTPNDSVNDMLLIESGLQGDSAEGAASLGAGAAALKAAGGEITRFVLPWLVLETAAVPPGGPPDFNPIAVERLNAVFSAARASGIKVILDISNPPCHRSSYPAGSPNPSATKDCRQLGAWASYPPADMGDLTNVVREIIRRWGPDIYGIEVWNEPNIHYFMGDLPGCDSANPAAVIPPSSSATRAARYVPMVKAVWQGVKTSTHPGIKVGAGSMAFSDTNFLNLLYSNGMQGYYDAISLHPYQMQLVYEPAPRTCADRWNGYSTLFGRTRDPDNPYANSLFSFKTGVPAIRSVMQQHGDNSSVWFTEFGFDGCVPAAGVATPLQEEVGQAGSGPGGKWNYAGLCTGVSWQADWLEKSFKIASQWPYVTAAVMYQLRDPVDGANQYGFKNFGVMLHDYTPKPAYARLAQTWGCLKAGTC